ncbi:MULTISPECIES: winged helix-turn-helix transcriptional regulator [Mycobacteriaceae]|nr:MULTISPECIES: helix-turn-helix domain-containing protein [Mycobacteriaceae]AHC27710.2 HxlR family transcriptional regulator [Mycolicibacterium neoaurum VKM Ac-1815D]AMO07888.1 HxlR family transcriptional regulator [Mycolicibacterium neoaurum]AXK77946.1 transcriptional regulator [Mycolicibacterium neoaurum]KJQ49718.1 HxlR family transcriptional regulator [Mycolicibacterium neoaurum]KUM07218.1 HxlR family transcriptional regulator [Mycolicibacterium neoaurum]
MRRYGQYCGLARSLEIVGDRWNLLIVRQLLIAPARYRDLVAGLPGIATNLLADRLRELESAGVVERRLGDGSTVEYALTPWGAELREPIEGLIRWSTPLMVRGPEGDTFRHEWLTLAIPALLSARAKVRATVSIGLAGEDMALQLNASRTGFTVGTPDGRELAGTLHAAPEYILGLAAGALTIDDARALGLIEIDGDEAAVRSILGATS